MTDKVVLDIDDMTLGELDEFEEKSGQSLADFETGLKAKSITILVYLFLKRSNPDYTEDDAKKVRLADVDFKGAETESVEANPTEGDS